MQSFHAIITGQEANELSNTLIQSSVEIWSLDCKSVVESYCNPLKNEIKENFRKIYLDELQKYKDKNKVKTSEIEDSNKQILYCNNIINSIENIINEEKNNFIIKNIITSIFKEYLNLISHFIKDIINSIIEDAKKEIIVVMQQEIINNKSFNEIFKYKNK